MNKDVVVNEINKILISADCPIEMYDISDIESFLSNQSNTSIEVYEVIEQLYSQLMEDEEIVEENHGILG